VRTLSREAAGGERTGGDRKAATELDRLLAGVDPGTATQLARAFTTFFLLANVAEQWHRAREESPRRRAPIRWASSSGGWSRRSAARR